MQFYFLFAVIYMYYIRRLAVESAGKLCRAVRCPVTVDGLTVSDIHGNVRFTPAAVGIIENIAGADLRFRNLCSQVDKALGLEDSVCNASSSKVRQPLKPACSTAAAIIRFFIISLPFILIYSFPLFVSIISYDKKRRTLGFMRAFRRRLYSVPFPFKSVQGLETEHACYRGQRQGGEYAYRAGERLKNLDGYLLAV